MADYDRRPRRGGGGHFNNSRKRRYRDDDFEDRRPQRRRYEEPLSVSTRRLVLSIADSPMRRVEDDVPYIAKTIADNYFDSDLTSGFVDLTVQITVEQPLRIPFIAAIILITNIHKPEFTQEILSKIGDVLQKHVNAGSWREVKLYMRLLGCLQGLFEGDGIFPLLEQFFERAADLQMQSSEDSLGLELVKIILLTIPYTIASPATGLETLANSLLEKTDVIASTPHALENIVDPFPSLEAGGVTSSESALALLQKHMQEEARSNWELACLPRAWKIPKTEGEEDPLPSAQKHPFPTINIPPTILTGPHPIYPEIYFSVYSDQELFTVPPSTDSSALLIRDACTDTINALDFNRGETAKFLVNIDCYFAPGTFVKRGTPFDKLAEVVAGDKQLWKPEDVIVDACFAQLFNLPVPDHKLVYYHSILTEACKLAPAAVAPSLGRAIRFLYRNVDRMDIELEHRFLDWFAHHLSNFGFTWKWTEWEEDVKLNDVNPKKAFIVDALDKEIRLSFAQRIRGTLPAGYWDLIGEERERDVPAFRFEDESVQFSAEAKEIVQLVRKKAGKEEYEAVLGRIEGEEKEKIDVFVTAVCSVGSKSLSHFLACVERTKEVFLDLGRVAGREAEKQIVKSVLKYWEWVPGSGVMAVDKLLNYLVVSPEAVVEAVLSEEVAEGGKVLSKGWVWEMIARVVGKVVGRVRGVVSAARKQVEEEKREAIVRGLLEEEMQKTRSLIAFIVNRVERVQDSVAGVGLSGEEAQLVRVWCAKWIRAWGRRGQVEENWVKEELAKPISPATAEGEAQEVLIEAEVKWEAKEDRDGDVGMKEETAGGERRDEQQHREYAVEKDRENGLQRARDDEQMFAIA